METLIQLWKSNSVPLAAIQLFTWLWEEVGQKSGTLEKMSYNRLEMLTGMSYGQVYDRLQSLKDCGLVEQVKTRQGEFMLHVHEPFAPRSPRPKKAKPTPLFDFAEKSTEIPQEKSKKNPEMPRVQKVAICSSPPKPKPRPEPETQPEKPPKTPQNTVPKPGSLQAIYSAFLAKHPPSKPSRTPSKTARSGPLESERGKNSESLHISNISIDLNNINKSIDQLKREKQRLFEEVRGIFSDKSQLYVAYMVCEAFSDRVIDRDAWTRMRTYALANARDPGKYIHKSLKDELKPMNYEKYKERGIKMFKAKHPIKPKGGMVR